MPYATIGLVWNSIVSVAGGWFALMLCEMFTMGNRSFQLPGLGSYMQSAADSGDVRALLSGIAVVILIVVATDQLVWRPLIAWSDKFKFEQVESADRVTSPILTLLQRSTLLNSFSGKHLDPHRRAHLSPAGTRAGTLRGAAPGRGSRTRQRDRSDIGRSRGWSRSSPCGP